MKLLGEWNHPTYDLRMMPVRACPRSPAARSVSKLLLVQAIPDLWVASCRTREPSLHSCSVPRIYFAHFRSMCFAMLSRLFTSGSTTSPKRIRWRRVTAIPWSTVIFRRAIVITVIVAAVAFVRSVSQSGLFTYFSNGRKRNQRPSESKKARLGNSSIIDLQLSWFDKCYIKSVRKC